ncbi:MAG TPA: ring-cleaving dioxygenase [Vicinamibacterales bacterium]|nr:ring-cleaving dioxygenase [Vicinamibacterales bacterium]
MRILGLHHVTATVDGAQDDLDFALRVLGLRLVKKTVNFDNHHVFHFYYGDRVGTPGTIWTTFPYRDQNVRVGAKGAGQVTTTVFSVPVGALEAWRVRLASRGIAADDLAPRFGDPAIGFSDPSGVDFELVGVADARAPWIPAADSARAVESDIAIRGLHSVTLTVRDAAPTVAFMTSQLGWRRIDESANRVRMAIGDGGPARTIDVVHRADAPLAVNGLGTVHHVAMAIGSAEEQLALRERLIAAGAKVTEVRDRCYFTSIYFREPGGVLFEVATIAPGFTVDEDADALGRGLQLPPWEEANRADIEAHLPAIRD